MSDEFALIDHMVGVLGEATAGAGVTVGPGDDAAVLAVPQGHELVVSTDALVAGEHYPPAAPADLVGYRSMAVATSDLAAMGAAAAWATVSLVAPSLTRQWAALFAAGIQRAALDFGLSVVGGNLARGPQSVTITVHGHVPAGTAILRSGATVGDRVYVSGTVGGAGLALSQAELAAPPPAALAAETPLRRYWKPTPRLQLGAGLRTLASAAIDISDGVAADLAHICTASAVCCDVHLERLPVGHGAVALEAAGAGDDYELAFTAPAASEERLRALAHCCGVPISRIGIVSAGASPTVRLFDRGVAVEAPAGHRHFH